MQGALKIAKMEKFYKNQCVFASFGWIKPIQIHIYINNICTLIRN